MDFFSEIGKRLTDAGQSVAQQTRNMADTAQLNSAIADAEKQIRQQFLALGQAYYTAHRDDESAEQREIIQTITGLYASIESKRERIKQIKGVTKCPGCGADVPADAVFCSSCGRRMDEKPAPAAAQRLCPVCHQPVEEDNLYCNYCGTKL